MKSKASENDIGVDFGFLEEKFKIRTFRRWQEGVVLKGVCWSFSLFVSVWERVGGVGVVYIVEVETSTLCSFYMFITNTNTQTNIF